MRRPLPGHAGRERCAIARVLTNGSSRPRGPCRLGLAGWPSRAGDDARCRAKRLVQRGRREPRGADGHDALCERLESRDARTGRAGWPPATRTNLTARRPPRPGPALHRLGGHRGRSRHADRRGGRCLQGAERRSRWQRFLVLGYRRGPRRRALRRSRHAIGRVGARDAASRPAGVRDADVMPASRASWTTCRTPSSSDGSAASARPHTAT